MEHRVVRGIVRIGSVHAANRTDLQRRLHRLHRTDLHRGCLRAKQQLSRNFAAEKEVVSGSTRRMAIGNVERVEVVPLILELRAVGNSESHAPEHIDDLVNGLGKHMSCALAHRHSRLGDIDHRALGRGNRRVLGRVERTFDRGLHFIHALANRWLLLLGHALQRIHRRAQSTICAKPTHAKGFKSSAIEHRRKFGERLLFHRVKVREHRRTLTSVDTIAGALSQLPPCQSEKPKTKHAAPSKLEAA